MHPDDRLVVDDDLVLLERLLEVAHDAAVERGAEDVLVARVALRRVHLAVGAGQELAGRQPVLREERPADRRVDLHEASVDPVRPPQGVAQAADERGGLLVARRAEREHDELVTPDARDRVDAPDDGLQPLGDHAQDGVAGLVAAHVVDALEPVDVDDEQRERLGRPLGARERLLDPVVEQRAVRQAGERVSEGEPLGGHQP